MIGLLAHPRSWSLLVKLPLTIGVIIGLVAAVIGVAIVQQQQAQGRRALEDRALTLAGSVATAAPEAALRADYWALYKILTTMTGGASSGRGTVTAAMILDTQGRTLAHLDPRDNPVALPAHLPPETATLFAPVATGGAGGIRWVSADDQAVEAVVPIRLNGTTLAAVVVRVSADELAAALWQATRTILALTLLLAVAGGLAAALISRRMVRPLKALAGGMAMVGRGDAHLIPHTAVRDHDEIGRLVEHFNRMSAEIAEARRREQEMAVNEKLLAIGRIAAGVAHEVNNPLAGMLNCLDTIRSQPQDLALVSRYLPVLDQGLHRIQRIVQGLLIELREPHAAAAGTLGGSSHLRALLQAEIEGRPIRLEWEVDATVEPMLCRPAVQQMLTNLFKNAVAAMPAGGRVVVRGHAVGGDAVLEVEDEGIGIAPQEMGRLFDPFYTTRNDGTGLGLWITWRLVEDMGGAIAVESEPETGTVVRLTLPLPRLLEERIPA